MLFRLVLILSLLSHCLAPVIAQPLVVVSIDGLNPDFYLEAKYEVPHLKGLAERGLRIREVYPVFPSYTYPNHASLVTGRLDKLIGVFRE